MTTTAPGRALVVVGVQQGYFTGPLEIQHPSSAHASANLVQAVRAARTDGVPVMVVQYVMPVGAPGLGISAEVPSDAGGAIALDNEAGYVPAAVVHSTSRSCCSAASQRSPRHGSG